MEQDLFAKKKQLETTEVMANIKVQYCLLKIMPITIRKEDIKAAANKCTQVSAYAIGAWKWTTQENHYLRMKLNGIPTTRIVDTGCLGVVILEGCYQQLELKEDRETSMRIKTAGKCNAYTKCKVFSKINIRVGKSSVDLPAVVLPRGYYNILLGIEWLTKVRGILDPNARTVLVSREVIKLENLAQPEEQRILFTKEVSEISYKETREHNW